MEHSTEQDEVQVAVGIPRPDQDEIEKSFRGDRIDFLAVNSQGFDGAHTIELVVTLTPTIAAFLAGLYSKRMAANRYISLKYKGIEVKGVSEATLLKIIDRATGKRK